MLSLMPKTCLVVPCYNEADRLPRRAFDQFVRQRSAMRVLFVNDGSRDATAAMLSEFAAAADGRADLLDLPHNMGKAEAVRQGICHALTSDKYDFIGYWDADLATPLSEVDRMLSVARENPEAVALLGCRLNRLGALVDRRWQRHLLGRVFATLADAILSLPVYDTQCGAKLFRQDLAADIFSEPFLSRWCFDVELLARVVARYGRELTRRLVIEVPVVHWQDVPGSKLRLRHCVRALADLVRISRHYRMADPVAAIPPTQAAHKSGPESTDLPRAA